ncbi:MAG TPA: N-acetylglucosamine-6-phosphate deacetylase, partial [Thermodesulfobacteriota bacterium]|nr:N-acetylglucosamine-6-phosphate deacetylase [Thermodesulfobacteriota bacterium]
MEIVGKSAGAAVPVIVKARGEKFTRIESVSDPACGASEISDSLCSGFFDPQVNGYAGVDFNRESVDAEGLHGAALALAASGVTRFLPTFTTASLDRTLRQLKTFCHARCSDPLLRRMTPGFHLEGPYISPHAGFRGAHPRRFIRRPRIEELKRFQDAAEGLVRCVTLAPEVEGAIPFIEKAVQSGIVIGIGHTNASDEALEDAFRAGARLSCHLGNGVKNLLPRHRNPVQKQLSMEGLMASIIPDGIHLPDYVVKNFMRAKGTDKTILTTDAMPGAGAPPGIYTIGRLRIEVGEDGIARLPGTPYLAGSTLTMDKAVRNVIRFAGIT